MSCMTLFISMLAKSPYKTTRKWAISLVIADGHFNLPQEFVWVCIG